MKFKYFYITQLLFFVSLATHATASLQHSYSIMRSNYFHISKQKQAPNPNDERIKESDQLKEKAKLVLSNKDYLLAKDYAHQAINLLKDSEGNCLDEQRVFDLKRICQQAQFLINFESWSFKHDDQKSDFPVSPLLDQLKYQHVPGYEDMTLDKLMDLIDDEYDNASRLKEEYFTSVCLRLFNDDGIDFALEDHMGLYHAYIASQVDMLATAANILNVNLVVFSKDTNEPIIFKQKNAVSTLYIGLNLLYPNSDNDPFIEYDSAYRDDTTTPRESIEMKVANAAYSYDDDSSDKDED
jgi:hypothetical protein